MYRKPNSLEIRKMSNAFGVMKNVTMMKIRERKLQQKELKKNSGKSKNGSTS